MYIYIRRTVTSREKGAAPHPLSCDGRPGVGRPRQARQRQTGRHSPDSFAHSPNAPRLGGLFPLDLTPCSKSYARRPTCPSLHHCQPPPFRPKIRFLRRKVVLPTARISTANEDYRANTSYAPGIIVSVSRSVDRYEFLDGATRRGDQL